MSGNVLSHSIRLAAWAAALILIMSGVGGGAAFADWIDTKTGKRVADWPSIGGRVIRGMDRNSAFDSETGRNFARNECGDWIDTKTGRRVASWPSIGGRVIRGTDRDHVFDPETGRNFAREACPREAQQAKPPKGDVRIEPKFSLEIGRRHPTDDQEIGEETCRGPNFGFGDVEIGIDSCP